MEVSTYLTWTLPLFERQMRREVKKVLRMSPLKISNFEGVNLQHEEKGAMAARYSQNRAFREQSLQERLNRNWQALIAAVPI